MTVRVAVSDPLPVFRRGIMAILGDAGFDPEAPDDLMTWLRDEQRRVVLMTLQSPEDWVLLDRLRQDRPDIIVVAVLEEVSVATYVRALTCGAVAAVPRDAPPEGVKRVFEAALQGTSLLPTDVIRALASPSEPPPDAPEVPAAREIAWLRELAHGLTVVQLANRAGYSERAMFRLLRDLYARMGVRNRTEALMSARERGWL
jgi:DNA-binding NarL/FixJ family response regulator